MKTLNIKNITLGEGRPKICLPIVGRTLNEIKAQTIEILKNPVDIIEWRADWFCDLMNTELLNSAIIEIRNLIGETPLLFTIRTSSEGGEATISFEDYSAILENVAANPAIDAVDIEIFISDEASVKTLIENISRSAVVIASNHDFDKTPDKDDICNRLEYMKKCGADVCKIAVMPQNIQDVLTLLSATNEAFQKIDAPIITMSMGKFGLISRLAGEVFGSSLTFGCVGKASAPGQIDAVELNTVLEVLHRNL